MLIAVLQLLQKLCDEGTVKSTKMDANNLAMVMAPNILRGEENDDPTVIFENSRKEMSFLRQLIISFDAAPYMNLID